jgi:hypothetical protein
MPTPSRQKACQGVLPCVQAFKEVLDGLHAFPHVHLIVATRVEAPAVNGVWGGAVVELSRLDAEAGMQLLDSCMKPGHCWSSSDKDAARKLVEVVQGNPLVLTVAAGLVQHSFSDLTWQVSSRWLLGRQH